MFTHSWKVKSNKVFATAVLLSLTLCPVYAAEMPTPDAGTVLGGNKQPELQVPLQQVPQISVETQVPKSEQDNGQKIIVNQFRITGQLPVAQQELAALVKDDAGKEFTLTQLQQEADKITQYLRQKGYMVADAYIPAQEVTAGTIDIAVITGSYGKIQMQNQSSVKDAVAESFLSDLKSGNFVQKDVLEKTLLLFNDIGGISAKATLMPGEAAGTSNLVITITNLAKSNGQLYADNWGNRYTGTNRLGFAVNTNNLSGHGDQLALGGVYAGSGMYNYNINYLIPTGREGIQFGVGYSQMHYLLGDQFALLGANGIAKTTSVFGSVALKRSREFNLHARLEWNHKLLGDETVSSNSQKSAQVWMLGLSGDAHDNFLGGGFNSFSLMYEKGCLGLDSAYAKSNDAYHTGGGYGKTTLNYKRSQWLNDRLTLSMMLTGQLAEKNLDSSEKLQLGGPTGVRAYPVGEASCDEGYLFTGELRWNLPTPQFQLAAFYDNGKARLSKNPIGGEMNKRILAGAGLGLIWNTADGYALRLDYAWKITTNNPATAAPDDSGRLWLQAVKYF